MTTDTKAGASALDAHAPKAGSLDDDRFEGDFVPMKDAKVSIMTHAFMYGTATFEGIRAYWNEEQGSSTDSSSASTSNGSASHAGSC